MTSDVSAQKLMKNDCKECRIIGTCSCAFIGTFIMYATSSGYYLKHPKAQLAVRGLGIAAYYLSAARWLYLPPFHGLKGPSESFPIDQ